MKINRLLLVDDDSISNFVSQSAVEKLGFAENIIVRNNGREALAFLEKECNSFHHFPDLIFLDLKMPVMDGFEFLKQFEKLCQNLMKEIVVVILTSSRAADDVVKLRGLGNYYMMNKPLTSEKLIDIYHKYFRNREVLH